MTRAITVADLKATTAETVRALPYSVPIKQGDLTVGVLTHDRDPAGTDWPSCSNADLVRALAA